jgi:endo-1,4-beta-xylanase
MINLVKSLKDAGTPIDGIGIQGHFTVAEVPSVDALIANFEAFTALGVEIAITELDIRVPLPKANFNVLQQQSDYQTVISACKAVAGCVGVTLWDYTDKVHLMPFVLCRTVIVMIQYSWLQPTDTQFSFGTVISGSAAACPWDEVRE